MRVFFRARGFYAGRLRGPFRLPTAGEASLEPRLELFDLTTLFNTSHAGHEDQGHCYRLCSAELLSLPCLQQNQVYFMCPYINCHFHALVFSGHVERVYKKTILVNAILANGKIPDRNLQSSNCESVDIQS